jgi:hypothetical protein
VSNAERDRRGGNMDRNRMAAILLACSVSWFGCTTERSVSHHRDTARGKNDSLAAVVKHDVVEMKKAGIGDDVVINLLRASDSFFPMYTRDVVELADSGVSDSVINAMILGFQTRSRDRNSGPPSYYAPYYSYWSNPYWYLGDPYYYTSRPFGFYRPYYGFGSFSRHGSFSGPHGFGRAPMGGRHR